MSLISGAYIAFNLLTGNQVTDVLRQATRSQHARSKTLRIILLTPPTAWSVRSAAPVARLSPTGLFSQMAVRSKRRLTSSCSLQRGFSVAFQDHLTVPKQLFLNSAGNFVDKRERKPVSSNDPSRPRSPSSRLRRKIPWMRSRTQFLAHSSSLRHVLESADGLVLFLLCAWSTKL